MIGLLLVVAISIPQAPRPKAQVLLLAGAVERSRLDLAKLGLGDGGLGAPVLAPASIRGGQALSPGGILVRAQREGVKLDFPSGAELLVSPSGGVHLRSGEMIDRVGSGTLELVSCDGAQLQIFFSASSGKIAGVQLIVGGQRATLWGRRRRPAVGHGDKFRGSTLLMLGDGRVLFKPVWLGPVLILERKLCPAELLSEYPEQRVVIIGDLLRDSLRELVRTIPVRTVEFPQAPEAVANLAQIAPILFADGSRPLSIIGPGPMLLSLPGDFRLRVRVGNTRTVYLGLERAGSEVPIVEWTITGGTRLQLVRPGGGSSGRLRYYLKGLLLRLRGRDLLRSHQSFRDEERARSLLVALGAVTAGRLLDAKR